MGELLYDVPARPGFAPAGRHHSKNNWPLPCQSWGQNSKTRFPPGFSALFGTRKRSQTARFWWRIDGEFSAASSSQEIRDWWRNRDFSTV